MRNRLILVGVIAALVFVGVLGAAGYFFWRSVTRVETMHARIMGNVAEVRAPGNGRVFDLPVDIGDTVMKDQILGTMELVSDAGRLVVPVRAPLSGVVVSKYTEEGAYLPAGQAMLAVVDPDDLWVQANIHESRIGFLQIGQPVQVRVRALQLAFTGRVEEISSVTTSALASAGSSASISTPSLVEVPVRIAFDNKDYTLYPGMSAEVRIQVSPSIWPR